jgi:peptidyl-prolyl cis-trans isomerase A (cyclophilin A)
MHGTNPGLDQQYTAFGQVTAGMEVVDAIASAEKDPSSQLDRPLKPVTIRKIELFRP